MLSQIKMYLIAGWFVLTISLLGYSYKLNQDVERLTAEVATYQAALEASNKATEQAKTSCLVSIETMNAYYRDQNALQTSQQATGDTILSLPTLTLRGNTDAAPTKPQGFSDDDRLSPDLMRLLDNAYCDGNKDGCAIPTK